MLLAGGGKTVTGGWCARGAQAIGDRLWAMGKSGE